MMQFYGLKTCDTCKKALKELQAAGHAPQVIDVRADGLSRDVLGRFYAAFGDQLVNRRSTTWRALSDDARAEDPVALILAHPTLMKRPVIDTGDALFLGWDAKAKAALT